MTSSDWAAICGRVDFGTQKHKSESHYFVFISTLSFKVFFRIFINIFFYFFSIVFFLYILLRNLLILFVFGFVCGQLHSM